MSIRFVLTAIILMSASIEAGQRRAPKKATPPAEVKQEDAPPVLPLTEAERALDLKELIANQPDFTADERFFSAESRGGFSGAAKVARKGDRYRIDNGIFVFIYQRGKPGIRVAHGSKVYDPLFGKHDDSIAPWRSTSPLALTQLTDASLTALGAQNINGHRCLKVEAIKASIEHKVILYLAQDLKYLAIAIQIAGKDRASTQTLHNVSLSVPDSLFDLSGYEPITLRKWQRMKEAQVLVNGKPAKEFSVFRALTGEMFLALRGPVMVNTFILRPGDGTAEVAFQGEIRTKEGEYIWMTKEEFGFSGPDTSIEHRLFTCRETNCPKVEVGSNHFMFADAPKRTIKVTWE